MSLLKITNLSHCFIDKPLYKNASLELYKGEHIGVVGQNGAGKSTLIKILLGEVIPDTGIIKWQSSIKIGSLDQYADIKDNITILEYLHTSFTELYTMEKEMNKLYQNSAVSGDESLLVKASNYQEFLYANGFYSINSEINKVVVGLGLNAIGTDKLVNKLSGGQKAKVILAKLLLTAPDVLLLDEPTNFLDKEHVEWLASYLSTFKGTFIVVSHDFDFLEKISTGICNIEFGTIKKYHGKYSEFLKQKTFLREDYIRQYNTQQREIKRTEAYINKNKAGVNCKNAMGRQKQLDRVERLAPPTFVEKPKIKFSNKVLASCKALEVKDLEVGYYYPLLPKLNFNVSGGEKLVITGFNGIGKSTVLKTLVGKIPSISGDFKFTDNVKIAYYEQDLSWNNNTLTPFEIISNSYPMLNKKEIRKNLSMYGVKEEHISRSISTLSGGEQSKVKLCRLLLSEFNFLILDEPTNHFDKETKEALLNAINDFKGSIILVSHEEKFYKDFADKIINIEDLFD
ncbi:ABC-F family ATP-binding cassette domain-containing protein [Sedimentibacter sp. zth1]|uniref:ABC-F family ATP-binding cassette domain-containing protein n=1 Tax=Sedimentibacter sp. zth1 TaxID=2816908 RepID=UPI001A9168C6|nr:ABC-F family ATP-binding cassette domain-containing protein [Sedimentibacter sp. zth1]QSX05094.1 ABC-F family ATP-binding cassette domain-containing protein [Sedimentibacter sp. zth1]